MAMEDAVAGNGHCHRGTVGLLLRVLRPPRDLLSFTYSLWPPSLLAPAQRQRWPEEQLPALQYRQTCSGQAISAQRNCLQQEAAGSETKTGRQPRVGAFSLRPETCFFGSAIASGERLQGARGATCMPHVSTAVHTRSKFLATPCVSCFARGRRPASAACIVENKRWNDTQLSSRGR